MTPRLVSAPPIDNPAFNDWQLDLTAGGQSALVFNRVVMRYLPLEADVQSLQQFCDSYLNLAPDFCRFQPVMPYVMMCVANYGSMGTLSRSLGWESQNELLFGVPVEWWQRNEKGDMAYRGVAMVSPFIYVDSGDSEASGRETFGWPKCHGWFANIADPWSSGPRDWRTLLSVNVQSFARLFASESVSGMELVRVEEMPPVSYSLYPPSMREEDSTIADLPRSALRWMSIAAHSMEMFAPKVLGGEGLSGLKGMRDFVTGMLHPSRGFVGALHANTINLKQIRDAADPNQACYQAYTNAQMQVKRIRRGALMGEARILRGDPSGGLRVRIRELQEQPIVSTLGLKVLDEIQDGADRVAELKPVMPFWVEADMQYENGETLCFRTPRQPWRDRFRQREGKAEPVAYDNSGSIGFQVPVGPFQFRNAKFRVMPLLADVGCMQSLVDTYLNTPLGEQISDRFEVYGEYAYLTVSSFPGVSAQIDNLGLWAKSGMNFLVPVLWYRDGKLVSAGLVAPFMFAESDIGVTTGREVNGWPTVMASLQQQPNPWGSADGPFASHVKLLDVQTDAMRVIGAGQEVDWHSVVEIGDGQALGMEETPSEAAAWVATARASLQGLRDRATVSRAGAVYMALANQITRDGLPLNLFSLKQFRDVENFGNACYQSVVRSRQFIRQWHDMREMERPMRVKINYFESLPIVKMLGLKVAQSAADGSHAILVPQRPFYLEVDLETRYGEVLFERVAERHWTNRQEVGSEAGYFSRTGASLDVHMAAALDDSTDMAGWEAGHARASERDDKIELLRVVATTLEPQIAVHEILSRQREADAAETPSAAAPVYRMRRDNAGSSYSEALYPAAGCGDLNGVAYWSPDSWPGEE
ncbi:MAG: hypothetical protein H6994_11705 [Pseudomonadales bacterium]|nr:hypothetical protein [Pseudomonadales bacterium]